MLNLKRLLFCLLLCSGALLQAQVKRYTLVINEIMADPSPIVGLPNAEYIELRNNGTTSINLNKWKIRRGNSIATIQTAYLLKPDSLVIICPRTQAVFFNNPEKTIGITSFPSLANETDLISVLSPDGMTIDAVEYDTGYYGNALKAQGGWSMELVHPGLPCSKGNWKASVHSLGGTPGKENSVLDRTHKVPGLRAIQCTATSNHTLLLELNMGADSTSLAAHNNYQLIPEVGRPFLATPIGPLFNRVMLQFPLPMKAQQVYVLEMKNIALCNGSAADSLNIKTGISSAPTANNLVINELLFNPPTGGHDFIELYNKGKDILNLRDLYLGAKDALGRPGAFVQASTKDHYFFPGEYRVLTEGVEFIKKHWQVDTEKVVFTKGIPTLPDNKGNIVVFDKQGVMIDALDYTEDMHFPLLRDKNGVSLERVDPHGRSSDRLNWHSASASTRYASPTKDNSTSGGQVISTIPVSVYPDLISPDNDGRDDFLQIHYGFEQAGTMLSAFLFHASGAYACTVVNNRLCGTSGYFNWYGLDDKKRQLPKGLYVVLVETFDLNGTRKRMKKTIAIR
jgi:hypothetical protein